MTQEQKLLTEAEWRERLAGVPDVEAAIAALDNAGLIAEEPVDPKAEAVHEISQARGITGASNIVSMRSDIYRDDLADAFERGREIGLAERPELTRERVREACRVAHNGWGIPDNFVTRLHAALTGEGRHVG